MKKNKIDIQLIILISLFVAITIFLYNSNSPTASELFKALLIINGLLIIRLLNKPVDIEEVVKDIEHVNPVIRKAAKRKERVLEEA